MYSDIIFFIVKVFKSAVRNGVKNNVCRMGTQAATAEEHKFTGGMTFGKPNFSSICLVIQNE